MSMEIFKTYILKREFKKFQTKISLKFYNVVIAKKLPVKTFSLAEIFVEKPFAKSVINLIQQRRYF